MSDNFDKLSSAELSRRIERLVDGETDVDELRKIVEALEADPDRWRDCALAFLEDQALRQACKADSSSKDDFAQDITAAFAEDGIESDPAADLAEQLETQSKLVPATSVNANTDGCDVTADESRSINSKFGSLNGHRFQNSSQTPSLNGNSKELESDNKVAEESPANGHRIPAHWLEQAKSVSESEPKAQVTSESSSDKSYWLDSKWFRRLAVAASLMLAFSFGILGRAMLRSDIGSQADSEPTLPMGGPSQAMDEGAGQPTLVGNRPFGELHLEYGDQAEDNSTDDWRQVSVPVYEKEAMPTPAEVGLSPDILAYLKERQIGVRSSRQLMTVQGPDDQTYLVPIESLDFRPNDRSKYQ